MTQSVSAAVVPPLLVISATSPHPTEERFGKRCRKRSANGGSRTALITEFHTRRGVPKGRALGKTVLGGVVFGEYYLIREDPNGARLTLGGMGNSWSAPRVEKCCILHIR